MKARFNNKEAIQELRLTRKEARLERRLAKKNKEGEN
jgi:hypothetical protein